MNADTKRRWVEALRSGEYQQGTEALKKIGDDGQIKFCCLGVLADILDVGWEDPNPDWLPDEYTFHHDCGMYREDLPTRWLDKDTQKTLYRMNDGIYGIPPSPFTDIADWIERNIKVTSP